MRGFVQILVVIFLAVLPSKAQNAQGDKSVEGVSSSSSFMFAAGRTLQQDTYLSPLKYRGPQVTLIHDFTKMTHWAQRRISFQSLLQGTFSMTENSPATATDWGGRLAYDAGWHYHWTPLPNLRLMVGGQMGTDFGILYNDRNGNNPAQGRFSVDVAASVAASYTLHLRRKSLVVRYQADAPLMGVMFSPQYGQSYYELSQGSRDHNICFLWPGSAPSLRQMVLLDIPFRHTCLRVGYLSDIRQSRVNHIKMHDVGRSFVLGFVRRFTLI